MTNALTVDLDRAILALSDGLDFIGVDEIGHGHRVGLMAANLATAMGWGDAQVHDALRAGLLHDCGVSSTREHGQLTDDLFWEGAHAHCERGFAYLSLVPALAYLAPPILEHHTPWADLQRRGTEHSVALVANLLFLCDRTDVVRAHGVAEGKAIVDVLTRYRGTHFAPELMAVFSEEARREAFWFALDEPTLRERVADGMKNAPSVLLSPQEVKGLAGMFGHIIDAKSPYTERHSQGVARVALRLGARWHLPEETLDQLEVAALLHDLGKLRVPDELLEKQGPLTADERRRMARHSFDTYEVLRRVFGDGPIAQWAAFHHEYVSGQGYPFHREGQELPIEARIIAVADVLQALAQKRPYRAPLTSDEIAAILDGMVFGGKLDGEVVRAVKDDLEGCRREALAEEVDVPA
ncbi:MAG: HD domain-containing phosphohydrolase [Solirubrobacterales bacterium]